MRSHSDYPPGVPCWVDTMQPDPEAAATFYGGLFGWDFDDEPYRTARLHGRRVAGLGQAPPEAPAFWATYVRVEALEATLERAIDAGGRVLVPPIEVGPHGRAAAIGDPAGVAIGLLEGAGAELVGEPGAWAMSALHTPDVAAAQAFYASVFGWEAEPAGPGTPLMFWRLAGEVVAVVTPTEGDVPPHWAVNFRTDDVDGLAARAVDLGGTLLMPPTDTPGFRNTVIADPQGGVIAVSAPARATLPD